MDDFEHLVAEADGVTLLYEDDAVEAVGDDKDRKGGGGEVELRDELVADGTIDICAPDDCGGDIFIFLEIEATGGGRAVKKEDELAVPGVETVGHASDVS